MNDPVFEELVARAARRELTAAEQAQLEAWLARHPEARPEWELEQRLNRSLRRLPNVPVSSNFTASVLRAAERTIAKRPVHTLPAWIRWVRGWGYGWQLAVACGALALVVTIQVRQTHQRAALAQSLAALPVGSLTDVELWGDFEQINALPNGPLPSVDQLAEAFK